MRWSNFLIGLLLAGICEARVKPLKEDNFEMAVASPGHLFVFFYAPWCEHCSALKPEFEKASRKLKEHDPPITFAKVDATKEEKLAKKYGVNGYPSLRFFKERESQPINAESVGRTAEELAEWASKVAVSPDRVSEVTSGKGIESFIADMQKGNEVGVVGFFEDSEAASGFIDVAEKFQYPVRFRWTLKAYARKYLGLEDDASNVAVLFKPFDEKRHVFQVNNTKEWSKKSKNDMVEMMNKMIGVPMEEAAKLVPEAKEAKELKEWVTTLMLPLVVPFTEGFMNLIFTGPIKVHAIIVVEPEDDNEDLDALVREAAMEKRGEVLHIFMPAIEETQEIRDFLGVGTATLPTMVISDMREATDDEPQGVQYLQPAGMKMDAASIIAFEQDFFDGKVLSKDEAKKDSKKKKTKGSKKKAAEEL